MNNDNSIKRTRDNYENNNIIDNNNNEYNIKLYNSVFNNIYLKKIIFKYLTIYNILYNNILFDIEEWDHFKHKEYLNNVTLDYEHNNLEEIPENIRHIRVNYNNLKSIPSSVESIKLFTLYVNKLNTIISNKENTNLLSKIHHLDIRLENNRTELNNFQILQSIKSLKIRGYKSIIKNGMVFNSLKRIKIFNMESIEKEWLFQKLSYACIIDSSPSIINQISSNCLIKLDFFDHFDSINNTIIFPETLQQLLIKCVSFNAKLPNNLKSFTLEIIDLEDTIIFPSSLENIIISIKNHKKKEVFNNRDSVPCNLKSLEFACSTIVDNNGQSILPNKLEKLKICSSSAYFGFNQILQVNELPSSLTYLDLGFTYNQTIGANILPPSLTHLDVGHNFNRVIDINVLPSNLKILTLGGNYQQAINPLAIPQKLKLLEIFNYNYIHSINLPVSTHPKTLISCKDINFYYQQSNTTIRLLRLPDEFDSPLSTLKLQDKSSLEYLHLGFTYFNKPIELEDLPINNNIKTLVLSSKFRHTINLEYFQNLETIIVQEYVKIVTKTIITDQQETIYNNYNLKNIILPNNNCSEFLKELDINFYKFIKINKDYINNNI